MTDRINVKHSVIDAIDSLMSIDTPDVNAQQISNLLAASISQLVPRDQRALCAMMAQKDACPLDVFRQILIGGVDGLEQLVVNAPWLETKHALEVIRRAGPSSLVRALARRHDLNIEVKRALRDLHDPATDRALELRQIGPEDTPIVEPTKPTINLEGPRRVLSTAEYKEYLIHAGEENPSLLATAISDSFDVTFRTARSVLANDDVRPIAALMRFIGVQKDMVEPLFTRLRWRRYPDRAQRSAFIDEFEALTLEGANMVLQTWERESAA